MDIYPLANNHGNNSDHNNTHKIQSVQMQKPSTVAADHTYKPEGYNDKNNVTGSAVNPSVKHRIKRSVLQSIKICLNHFPEEVQEEGQKTESYFRYSKKLPPFQNAFLSYGMNNNNGYPLVGYFFLGRSPRVTFTSIKSPFR